MKYVDYFVGGAVGGAAIGWFFGVTGVWVLVVAGIILVVYIVYEEYQNRKFFREMQRAHDDILARAKQLRDELRK